MAFLWLPFVAAAHAVAEDPDRLRWLVSATLLFSFAHQPLTLWLVYGDSAQRRARPLLAPRGALVALLAVASAHRSDPTSSHSSPASGTSPTPSASGTASPACTAASPASTAPATTDSCGPGWRMAVVVALGGTDLGEAARRAGIGSRNTTAIDALAAADVLGAVLLLF